MKNIIFFITHSTLDLYHTEIVFESISKQSIDYPFFDVMYLYNTHQKELSNNVLLDLYEKYNLKRFIKELRIFNYPEDLPKKLTYDISLISSFCSKEHSKDRILILKSDTAVSKNYFKDLSNLDSEQLKLVVAPYVCAKERISKEKILEYCEREHFIESDEITFFTEDENGNTNSDFNNRPDISIDNEQIEFFSCRVVRVGFTSVYADCELLQKIILTDTDWGGTDFSHLLPYYTRINDSFLVHIYHGIISENRKTDREGPVKKWLES
jgi:hypothetical protein